MQSAYLSNNELADLIDCDPKSKGCMRKWLIKENWPFVLSKNGFPKVARAYHDSVLLNKKQPKDNLIEPNFEALL